MYSEEEYIFFALRLIEAKLLSEESYNRSMNNNKYVLTEQNQKFYDTFDIDERQDLDKLAQKIFDDVVSFFDKYDGLGCSYSDLIELVSELAIKKSFEL